MKNYFEIKLNNENSLIYQINYKNEIDLIKKVIWIAVSVPKLTKSMTIFVKHIDRNYRIYCNNSLFTTISLSKLDGRSIRRDTIYTTPASEIDRQFYNEYTSLNLANLNIKYM